MEPRQSGQPTQLSELEGAVLGVVSEEAGLTAHGIREIFRKSRSSHWSGSAGAIYPLVRKLDEIGLLQARETPRGSGVRRAYWLTKAGLAALQKWIGPPVAEWTASVTFDPLRSRVGFLAVLPEAQQCAFLEQAENALAAELEATKAELAQLENQHDDWSVAAAQGCLAVTRARLEWIGRCKKRLRS